eukprot:TRINITY_DN1124_c0_g1_i3.p1 TRINITY_DN1124_c0_g1~~TRINITY_DN1124_c0_g1_i3.p1  ORF type:complete len:114 (+),score=18.09 TRINITY_DN1124_c0_g1_i3:102-443(+)
MDEYSTWLKFDRSKRELIYALNKAMNKIEKGEFSYLRLEGLQQLFVLLQGFKEDQLAIFLAIQELADPSSTVTSKMNSCIISPPSNPRFSPITPTEKTKAQEIVQMVSNMIPL